METIYFIMIGFYGMFILFILLYSLMQANLVFHYWKVKKKESEKMNGGQTLDFNLATLNLPQVTIQQLRGQ